MAGIYIHIPFCSQFCTYCNFYSVKQLGLREQFVDALLGEAAAKKDFFKDTGSSVTTIYIGGGTPSVLSLPLLERLVGGVKELFGLQSGIEEFTIEVNPNDITPEYAAGLVALGVTRVSMGVQTFIASHLKWMNRRHTAEEGVCAFRILRDAGVKNISLDLIFGYELLSEEDWKYNIDRMTALAPEHISAYQLSIESGSALGAMARRGEYRGLSDAECEKQYHLLQRKLSEAGYEQYEISNFAKRNSDGEVMKSQHNSSYWDGTPYLGLGPAAHSYNGKKRFWNNPSVKKYCNYYNKGEGLLSDICGYEELSAENIFDETIMLGLRRTCGFSLESLDKQILSQIIPQINSLISNGLLVMEGDNVRIPAHKLFVSDFIIERLFV